MHESIGQLVTSRAGRDRGRPYLVLGVLDERFVLVADGDQRTVERPKRKNVKHLVFHRAWARDIREALATGRRPGNQEVRRALAALVAEHFGERDGQPEAQGG
ncbi:MAG: RNA-binding protein [Bacillota bacterium]|nr:MAG: RNA-binding protein [Bacillota bacterium]